MSKEIKPIRCSVLGCKRTGEMLLHDAVKGVGFGIQLKDGWAVKVFPGTGGRLMIEYVCPEHN